MRKSRFTEEQIIKVLKGHADGFSASDLCRKYGISDCHVLQVALALWRDGDLLKGLEEENRKLKRLLVESTLDISTLKEMLGKNF
jgi:putative transposase